MASKKKHSTTAHKTTQTHVATTKSYNLLYIVLLLTAIVYAKSIFNGFVFWDDDKYILVNPDVQAINMSTIKNWFTTYYAANYQPVTLFLYAVQYLFWEGNATGYHLVNLILHLLNTFLIYKLTMKLTGKDFISIFSCAVFGLHPMHSESVFWIAAFKDMTYTFFFLLASIQYLNIYEKRTYFKNISIVFLLFLLSALSKSAAVIFPLVMILIDYYLGRFKTEKFTKILVEKIPFFLVSISLGVVAMQTQEAAGAINEIVKDYTLIDRFFLLNYSIVFYVFKFLFPFGLSIFHDYPIKSNSALPWVFYFSPLMIALFVGLYYKFTTIRKEIVLGFGFYFINILLVLQIVPVGHVIVAERYSYLSYLGLSLVLGAFIVQYLKSQIVQKYLLFAMCILWGIGVFLRTNVWDNGMNLWTDAIEKNPNTAVPYYSRGYIKWLNKDYEGSVSDYQQAVKNKKRYAIAWYNMGISYYDWGKYTESINAYDSALVINPQYRDVYNNRGISKFKMNRFQESIDDYTKVIALDPNANETYFNRALVYQAINKNNEAINDLEKVLSLNPNSSQAYYYKAVNYQAINQFENAITNYSKAIELNSQYKEAFFNRGSLRIRVQNNGKLAIEDFDKVESIDKNFPQLYGTRGTTKMVSGDHPGAIEDFSKALSFNANDVIALYNRGTSYLQIKQTNQACVDFQNCIKMGYPPAEIQYKQFCLKK